MIAYIKGKVLEKTLTYLIVENQGLGYKVFTTPEVMQTKNGETVALYTYFKVSDDGQSLFGLPDFKSLQFFELLLTVSGVGPKGALGILSASSVATLENAIANQDMAMFTRMAGVGKKTAERIILELKNKVGSLPGVSGGGPSNEIYDALLALGYSTKEARDASAEVNTSKPTGQQLKEALKFLNK